MEAAMMRLNAFGALLGRVRDWWRRQEELSALDNKEIGRIADDLRISTATLRDLVARGPDAANQLYERMQVLGTSKTDVDEATNGVMRDLQRTCACCSEKRVCEKDLVERPDDPVWKSYCPNVLTLETITNLKTRSSP
jgi:hypothetical protein